jgi:hypothetical protein
MIKKIIIRKEDNKTNNDKNKEIKELAMGQKNNDNNKHK